MSDLPPDLPRLQVLETYLNVQLRAVQAAIRQAQHQAAGPATSWRIEHVRAPGDTTTGHGILHRDGCRVGTGSAVSRGEAITALAETSVMPCAVCQPGADLQAARAPRT